MFDHMVDTKPDGDAGGEGKPARRVEVISGAGRRRQWSTDEKARILFESLVPGANVSAVARRHGISPQHLFGWRKEAREQWAADEKARPSLPTTPTPVTPAFVPVMVSARSATTAATPAVPPMPPTSSCPGRIEIAIGDCIVRVIGAVEPEVLTTTLGAVLSAVRKPR
jgi:transposase